MIATGAVDSRRARPHPLRPGGNRAVPVPARRRHRRSCRHSAGDGRGHRAAAAGGGPRRGGAVSPRARHRRGAKIPPIAARSLRATASGTDCCRNWRASGIPASARPWPTPRIGRWPKRPIGRRKSTGWPPGASMRTGGAVLAPRRTRWPACRWRPRAAWCGAPSSAPREICGASISGTLRRSWIWPAGAKGMGGSQAPGWKSAAPSIGCGSRRPAAARLATHTACPAPCREPCEVPGTGYRDFLGTD